jgi:hypothetical protein
MKRALFNIAVRLLEAAARPPKPMPRIRWY